MTQTAMQAAEAEGLTVAGLAVAVPALVETEQGLLHVAPDLEWVDVPVARLLAGRFAPRSATSPCGQTGRAAAAAAGRALRLGVAATVNVVP